MLEIPTLQFLRQAAEADLEVEAGSVLRQSLRRSIAYAIAGVGFLYLKGLQWLSKQFFIDTASPAFKLLWASIYGVTPQPATQAYGPVQVYGVNGDALVGGEILEREDGATFYVDGPYVIGGVGEVTVNVIAVDAGALGNTDPTVTLRFQAPPGTIEVEAAVIGDGLENGFDVESVADLGERTLAQIRAARRGGSEADYEIWAREVSGIAQAYAVGSYAGIGTVLVIIAKRWDPTDLGDSPIPSAGLIAEVEAYLAARKPAGLHLVAVQPPVLQTLDPYIVLDPDSADIQTAVTKSLALALAAVRPDSKSYYDDMVKAIDRAAGEGHHRIFVSDGGVLVGPYDTQLDANSLLVPGTITWTEPP